MRTACSHRGLLSYRSRHSENSLWVSIGLNWTDIKYKQNMALFECHLSKYGDVVRRNKRNKKQPRPGNSKHNLDPHSGFAWHRHNSAMCKKNCLFMVCLIWGLFNNVSNISRCRASNNSSIVNWNCCGRKWLSTNFRYYLINYNLKRFNNDAYVEMFPVLWWCKWTYRSIVKFVHIGISN